MKLRIIKDERKTGDRVYAVVRRRWPFWQMVTEWMDYEWTKKSLDEYIEKIISWRERRKRTIIVIKKVTI